MSRRCSLVAKAVGAAAATLMIAAGGPALAHDFRPATAVFRYRADDVFELTAVSSPPLSADQVALANGCRWRDAPRHDGTRLVASVHCTGALAFHFDRIPAGVIVYVLEHDREQAQLLTSGETFALASRASTNVRPPHASPSYVSLGFFHILAGWDHLLFLVALMLVVAGRRELFWTISAFTVGHSASLVLAHYRLVSVSAAVTEGLIALSIALVARQALRMRDQPPETKTVSDWRLATHPAVLGGLFGIFHGLGFAGPLLEAGLGKTPLSTAVLAFNIGVEAGQIVFIASLLAALVAYRAALAHRLPAPQRLARAIAFCIGVTGATLFVYRVDQLL